VTELPRRLLGATGLHVTSLCFGCAEIGSMTETFDYSVPEDRALELANFPIPEGVWRELDKHAGPVDDPETVRWRRD